MNMKNMVERGNIMAQDSTNEQDIDHYVVPVQENKDGELFVELPQKLIDQLDWKVGDEVEWGETRLVFMLTLSNQSKKFRDADEARKTAISIDME
jgi:hypothetical protein